MRGTFALDAPVRRATLYATAQGVYQVEVNGSEVDDEVLKPGWTAYRHRLLHESTDVTSLVRHGENAVGVWLSGGWWSESYGFQGMAEPFYGDQPAVALQLVVELEDGTTRTVVTDGRGARRGTARSRAAASTRARPSTRPGCRPAGPSRGSTTPAGRRSGWSRTAPCPGHGRRRARARIEEVAVREVLTTPSGRTVLDFGQNLVGWLRIRVRGERGSRWCCSTPRCSSTAS